MGGGAPAPMGGAPGGGGMPAAASAKLPIIGKRGSKSMQEKQQEEQMPQFQQIKLTKLEQKLYKMLLSMNINKPLYAQYSVNIKGEQRPFSLDFAFPTIGIGIEGDGEIRIATKNTNIDEALAEKHAGLKPGRYAVLSVEDTGSGMNDEILAKVFEPVFTTKFKGRGLGLAAVYGTVKNHGSYIAMESTENKGTTCTIYLPAVEAEVKQPPEQPAAVTRGTETILVVDDEEILLTLAA